MAETIIPVLVSGPIAGIPGTHAPGSYFVDYVARTIRPVADPPVSATPTVASLEAEVAHLETEIKAIETSA